MAEMDKGPENKTPPVQLVQVKVGDVMMMLTPEEAEEYRKTRRDHDDKA